MVTEQVISTTILARIENDVGIKREKDRDHSNCFGIVDLVKRETILEMEEVDKKHISASVMKKPMVDEVLENVFTVNKIPCIKGLSRETTTSLHNLHAIFKNGNPKIPVKRRREEATEISFKVMSKTEEGKNGDPAGMESLSGSSLCAVEKKGLTDPR